MEHRDQEDAKDRRGARFSNDNLASAQPVCSAREPISAQEAAIAKV